MHAWHACMVCTCGVNVWTAAGHTYGHLLRRSSACCSEADAASACCQVCTDAHLLPLLLLLLQDAEDAHLWLTRAMKQAQAPAASGVQPSLAQKVLAEVRGWRAGH